MTKQRNLQIPGGWEASALAILVMVFLTFGLVSVYSASIGMSERLSVAPHYFALRQLSGAVVGGVLMAITANIPYRWWKHLAWPCLVVVSVALLVLVLPGTEGIAPEVNGARRWLRIGPGQVQPSEFAKFALIVWTAQLAVKKQDVATDFARGTLPFLVVWGGVALLIGLEPNLSTALLVVVLAVAVWYSAGMRVRHVLVMGLVLIPVLLVRIDSVTYQAQRVAAFMQPGEDPSGASYQGLQANIALGSGGLTGVGFGVGQQKYGFLPEPHNDFILAMIGEEWGYLGVAGLSLLLLVFLWVGYRAARQAPDLFGYLLALGLTNLIGIHAALHFCVNLGVLPTTGVTLPFVSYGRSSLLVCLAAAGVIVNVARKGSEVAR